MKTVLTMPEASRVLKKATQYLSYRSSALVEKLTLDKEKLELISEVLEDSEPGSCYTLEQMLNLTPREKEVAYAAIKHVLKQQIIQIGFANEYDDEGAAYPMLFFNISLDDLLI